MSSYITETVFTGNGSTTSYVFTFEYLTQLDVKVAVDGVDVTKGVSWNFTGPQTIQFIVAPANGAKIRIYRDTLVNTLYGFFSSGAAIRSSDLNNNFTQALYLMQELRNNTIDRNGFTLLGILDMNNFRITNVGTPTTSTDAVTKQYVDSRIGTGDKGEITVSPDGTTWTINNGAVNNSKIAANAAITGTQLASNAGIVGTQLAANAAIAGTQLASNAGIVGTQLASNAGIVGTQLSASANIAGTQLASNAGIVGTQLAVDTITATQLAANAVGTSEISAKAVTLPKIEDIATNKLLGRGSAGSGPVEQITLGTNLSITGGVLNAASPTNPLGDGDKGDITVSTNLNPGDTWTIDPGAVSYSKIQNVSTNNMLLGRASSGAGPVQEITLGTNLSLSGTTLNVSDTLTDGNKGDITVSNSGGTWKFTDATKGDIIISGSGATLTIANDAVTFAKLQNVSQGLIGFSIPGSGNAETIRFSDTIGIVNTDQLGLKEASATTGITTSKIRDGAVILAKTDAVATATPSRLMSRDANGSTAVYAINNGRLGQRKNYIINGSMDIAQRGNSSTVNSGFAVDRWRIVAVTGGTFTATQRSTDGLNPSEEASGFATCLRMACNTTDTSIAAGDYLGFYQGIEGSEFARFEWGTARAKPATISFWVRSSKTGTYGVSFRNSAQNRTYVATYTINSANTWEKKAITVAGDTSGTWLTTTGVGVTINFTLMSGSNFTTSTLNTWQAADDVTSTGQVNFMDSSANTWDLTGVQLEMGSNATSFEFETVVAMALQCIRYYQGVGIVMDTTLYKNYFYFPMRATPVVVGLLPDTGSGGVVTPYTNTTAFQSVGHSGPSGAELFLDAEF